MVFSTAVSSASPEKGDAAVEWIVFLLLLKTKEIMLVLLVLILCSARNR